MRTQTFGWIIAASIAMSVPAAAAESDDDAVRRFVDASLGRYAVAVDASLPASWNQKAYEIGYGEDQFKTFKAHRAFAMMHLAMHDALNAVVPVYRPYAFRERDPQADPVAAAAQAAHDVLRSQYPGESAALALELDRWLLQVPSESRKTSGLALGKRAAAAILALREQDGWNVPGTYAFVSGAGAYETTPPWDGFVLQPGFRSAKPFVLQSPDQFRPKPPPALDSDAYAKALNEVKEQGCIDSRVRTADQAAYAVWWMEFSEGSINRLARRLVAAERVHLWRAARMFALLNVSLFDGYVATWDAKYEYNHWRPYTAIRSAEHDRNPKTAADTTWESLRPAPPFPEYLSAHAAASSASLGILEQTFGDELAFTLDSNTAPPGMQERRFENFTAAAEECADSRVRLGFHFRYATDAGLELGKRVAGYVAEHSLERLENTTTR